MITSDKRLLCFVSPTVWSCITPHPDRSNNTAPKVGLIPVSSGRPFRLAAHVSTSPSLFPHCPLLALFPGRWQLSAEIGPTLGGGSRLQPGPVTLISAPPWDKVRAPERRQSGRLGVCDWDGGTKRWERTPLLQQPGTWKNFFPLESSGSQQKLWL